MKLHTLKKQKGAKGKSKRRGRGYGSGVGGHTIGKGMKGQKSRSGAKIRPGFEGGQVPLYIALPQYRGFGPKRNKPGSVNISEIDRIFKTGEIITLAALKRAGLIRQNKKSAKVLAFGDTKKKFTIKGLNTSESAKEKILKAGGKIDA